MDGAVGSGPFSIDTAGVGTLASTLDYETKISYVLKVKVVDKTYTPNLLTATYTLTVNVSHTNFIIIFYIQH